MTGVLCAVAVVAVALAVGIVRDAQAGMAWASTASTVRTILRERIETKHFVVFAERRPEGQEIATVAERRYSELAGRLGADSTGKIQLFVYHNHSAFLADSPSSLAVGYAEPFSNRIVISATKAPLDEVIGHELTHLLFIRSVPQIATVPFWFVEGLAIYLSRPGLRGVEIEAYALARDVPGPIELAERPEDEQEASRRAAQGYLITGYIADTYGESGLDRLVRALQDGADFDQAVRNSLGVSVSELERAWRRHAERTSLLIRIESLQYFGLLVLAVAVIAAVIAWFIKRGRRLAALEAEEEEDEEEDEDGPGLPSF